MTSDPCEGCGRDVHIAGGSTNVWDIGGGQGGGMTLELDDDTEYFLCFECIETLPDDATREDVMALEPYDPEEETDSVVADAAVPTGLTVGAVVGLAASPFFGDTMLVVSAGMGIGILAGLAWPHLPG